MPVYRVRFLRESELEALAAMRWYATRDPPAGQAFLRELERAIDEIRMAPRRWPLHPDGTRRYLLRRFPFFVVYREAGAEIDVVAVAHGRRKPGYWRSR